VKRARFHDPEHLPPTGSSTRSPWSAPARCRTGALRRRPFATPRVTASQLGSVRCPQPQPGTTCASQTPPVDFCLSNTTREHTDAGSSSRESAFSSPSGDPEPKPWICERCEPGPKPVTTPESAVTPVGNSFDPACAQRRRGQLELFPGHLPVASVPSSRPWNGRASGRSGQGSFPAPHANAKPSREPRCLQLPVGSTEALLSGGNRRAPPPRGAT